MRPSWHPTASCPPQTPSCFVPHYWIAQGGSAVRTVTVPAGARGRRWACVILGPSAPGQGGVCSGAHREATSHVTVTEALPEEVGVGTLGPRRTAWVPRPGDAPSVVSPLDAPCSPRPCPQDRADTRQLGALQAALCGEPRGGSSRSRTQAWGWRTLCRDLGSPGLRGHRASPGPCSSPLPSCRGVLRASEVWA